MKGLLQARTILLFVFAASFAVPNPVLASEGDDSHGLEVEVNGYHVTLASQNKSAKGENIVMLTIRDEPGMPVSDAEVELLIAPKACSRHERWGRQEGGRLFKKEEQVMLLKEEKLLRILSI